MADVLLVNPPFARLSFAHGVSVTYMPLGLGYVGARLVKEGFAVAAVDSDILGFDERQTADYILRENPPIVGLSVMSTTLRSAYAVACMLRESGFSGEVVVGGPHVTAMPEAVADMGLEYGVVGEGEEVFTRLVKALLDGTYDISKIPCLYVASKRKNVSPAVITNIDSLHTPARSLFPVERYSHISVITSRGCPMSCEFCLMPAVPYRSRSPEGVVSEVEDAVREFGKRAFSFVDDNFTLEKERTLRFCSLLREKSLGVSFNCQTRPDLLDEEVARALKSAGCRLIFLGVESGSEEVRRSVGKDISDESFVKAFSICRKYGIASRAYFMLGFPCETRKEVEATLEFPKKIRPDDVDYSVTEIYPCTRLAERMLKEGVITCDAWSRYMRGEAEYPVYVPDGFTREELFDLCLEGYRRFYFSGRYLLKKFKEARSISDFNGALAHAVYTLKANLSPVHPSQP
jgi:radical SAM superfamily enzyme YgiQ (UPF0313 family)